MGKSTDRWTTKRSLKALRGLLEVTEEARFLRDLDTSLRMEDEGALPRLVDTFYYSSAWSTARGILAVYEGDARGWQPIHTGFRQQALRRLVRFSLHDALKAQGFGGRGKPMPIDPLYSFDLADICRALLYAMATREDLCATLLGDRLVRHFLEPDGLIVPDAFGDTPFESYTVLLYCRWTGTNQDAVQGLLSEPRHFALLHSYTYRQVIESWGAPDAFAAAVRCMVELRSKWTDREDEPWSSIPYGVVPVEFLALERVRAEQGQPFEFPDHPMLQTPWAAVPEGLNRPPDDEWWSKVVARCRQLLPGLLLPANWEPARREDASASGVEAGTRRLRPARSATPPPSS